MNYLATFLAHSSYKKPLLFIDSSYSEKELLDLLNCCNFDHSYVVYDKNIADLPENSTQIDDNDALKKDFDTVVFYKYHSLEDSLYELFSKIKNADVMLLYEKGKIDFLKCFDILRVSNKSITTSIESDIEIHSLGRWKKDPTNDIELSVILPVYNVGKYLDQCISTVTAWKAPYVEFLFVNDGSQDNSAEIITEASKKDLRIKLINKENGGCASAREVGLQKAKGQYVGFIDPDDFIDETMFSKLFVAAMKDNYDISYCGYNEYYENNGKSKPVKDNIENFKNGSISKIYNEQLICYLRIGIWRAIYRRQFLIDNNIHFHTELRRFDDLPFKVEVHTLAEKVISVPEYMYYYRLNRKGQDVSANDQRLYVHFDIFRILDEFFKDKTDAQKEYYKVVKRDTHNWALSKIDKKYKKEYISKMK